MTLALHCETFIWTASVRGTAYADSTGPMCHQNTIQCSLKASLLPERCNLYLEFEVLFLQTLIS